MGALHFNNRRRSSLTSGVIFHELLLESPVCSSSCNNKFKVTGVIERITCPTVLSWTGVPAAALCVLSAVRAGAVWTLRARRRPPPPTAWTLSSLVMKVICAGREDVRGTRGQRTEETAAVQRPQEHPGRIGGSEVRRSSE